MNLPVYSLENKKIIYFFLAIMLIGGIYSFFKLPKKEDSPFVIKQAVLVTQYPGATSGGRKIDNGTYREGNSVHVGCFSDQV